jgi:hypothetical protein
MGARRGRPTNWRRKDTASPTAACRGVWLRHGLETSAKRLKALEAKVAQEGRILTEAQVSAPEKVRVEKRVASSRVSAPGYGGRICQQTFIDAYSRVEDIDHTRTKRRVRRRTGSAVQNEFLSGCLPEDVFQHPGRAANRRLAPGIQRASVAAGRWCYGKTSMQAFVGQRTLAKERLIA